MVDVSHGNDSVFYDAIKMSKAPIIASHSNARSVTNHKRNMTDEMLKLMSKNGGVVQLTMLADYLREAQKIKSAILHLLLFDPIEEYG